MKLRPITKQNKKGAGEIIIFFLVLFTILIVGFAAVIIMSIVDFGSDTLTPVMNDLGVIGSSNMSEYSGYSIDKLDDVIQAFPFIIGLCYVLALVFTVVFAMSMRMNPHPVFIALYFAFMLLLVVGSIVMSNIYEDLYESNDEIGTRLQEQTLMSYMILFSPLIMSIITIIAGIFLFARPPEAGGVI